MPSVKRSPGVLGPVHGKLKACFFMHVPSTLFLARLMNSGAVKIVYCKQTNSSLAYWKDKECHVHEHSLGGTHKRGKAVAPSLWLFGAADVWNDLAC